jgi:hypothetical protein
LFDAWPSEVVLLKRRRKFLSSILSHDFEHVREASLIDKEQLLTSPLGWHNNFIRLMRRINPDLSTVSYDPVLAIDTVLSGFDDRPTLNFFYIKGGSSDSLSFFQTF